MNEWVKYEEEAQRLESNGFNTWRPDVGQSLVGRVRAITPNSGKEEDSTVVEIEDREGVGHSVWMLTVLEKEFKRLRIGVGDVIGIRYLGLKRNPNTGRDYKDYGVKVFEKAGAAKASSQDAAQDPMPF